MRSFIVVGSTARADGGVRLDDLPGTSGRLDVLARSVRAALCVSHGIRRDVRVYLVLQAQRRTVRIDGADARFIRPDERPLATLLLKTLARAEGDDAPSFVVQRSGIAVARGALAVALRDVGDAPLFVLEEGGAAVGGADLSDAAFVIGDHAGFAPDTRAELSAAGARALSIGPVSLHTDDVVTVLNNTIDRRSGLT